ncbi:MAG: hypothetical protein GX750_05265 [Clostridia bacterium]|nr:hypothetical protein [Clostridia bacterium]
MRKWFIMALVLMFGVAGGAASARTEIQEIMIKAVYQNIKLVVNGRLVNTPVEPFQLEDGYLMVPARALGEALGCQVEWDPQTKVVYISDGKIRDRTGPDKPIPIYLEQLPVLRNVGPFFRLESRKIAIATHTYDHGLVIELVKPSNGNKEAEAPGHYGETVVQLKGNYSWLEGYLGVDDETRNSRGSFQLQVFGDGNLLYESKPVKPAEYPVKIKVNVETVQRLSFVVHWLDAGLGAYDRLLAVLADFQVY